MTTKHDIITEHDAGEHFDAIVVDCPTCEAEWSELTGAIQFTARMTAAAADPRNRVEEGEDR